MTWMVACSHGMRLPLCQIFEVVWMGMSVNELLETRSGANIQAYRGCGATVIRPMSLDHTHGFDLGRSHIGCKGVMNRAIRQPCTGSPEGIPLPVLRFNREEACAGRLIHQNRREEAAASARAQGGGRIHAASLRHRFRLEDQRSHPRSPPEKRPSP